MNKNFIILLNYIFKNKFKFQRKEKFQDEQKSKKWTNKSEGGEKDRNEKSKFWYNFNCVSCNYNSVINLSSE